MKLNQASPLLVVLTLAIDSASAIPVQKRSATDDATAAVASLMDMYNQTSGLWGDNSTSWWISGNALQSICDYMELTGTTDYISQAENTVSVQRAPVSWWPQGDGDFRSDSTDDTGWWALANLRLYDLTGTADYLTIAEEDEAYIYSYRDNGTCGPGILWNIPTLSYVNAISNELYFLLAASLHNRVSGDTTYLSHAMDEWAFFEASGIINSDNLINDGLSEDSPCVNNGMTVWSYNQGVILGGLVELYKANGNATLLTIAQSIADAATQTSELNTNGILTESCEAAGSCDVDQRTFKGIFTRYLGVLNREVSGQPYTAWLTTQANSAYANDRNGSDYYGLNWAGPSDTADVGSQVSALSLLTSIL